MPTELLNHVFSTLIPVESISLAITSHNHLKLVKNCYAARLLPELQGANNPIQLYTDPRHRKDRCIPLDSVGIAFLNGLGIVSLKFINHIKEGYQTVDGVLNIMDKNLEQFQEELQLNVLSPMQVMISGITTVEKYAANGMLSAEQFLAADARAVKLLSMKVIQEKIELGALSMERFLEIANDKRGRQSDCPFDYPHSAYYTHGVLSIEQLHIQEFVAY